MLKLSLRGERLRWRAAAFAMAVIFLEVFCGRAYGWGIYAGVIVCAAVYFTGDMATTRLGGGYFLAPSDRAWRRRWMMLPAVLVFGKGTDFRHASAFHVFVLSLAFLSVVLLLLVPEPRE